jgi:hypothetical protein
VPDIGNTDFLSACLIKWFPSTPNTTVTPRGSTENPSF